MNFALLIAVLLPLASQAALIVGGLTDINLDANDANVQFAVQAINAYYTQLGDTNSRTLVKVVHAQSQVVAGTLYYLDIQVTSNSKVEECHVEVWSRPWLSGDEAIQVSKDPACKDVQATAAPTVIPGGQMAIDPNAQEVQMALTFAVSSLNAQENYMFNRKAVKIDSVTSQVVSGLMFRFRGVHMAATNCAKGSNSDLSQCAVANNADTRSCDFDVWWQSWMTPEYKLMNINCQNRGLSSGVTFVISIILNALRSLY